MNVIIAKISVVVFKEQGVHRNELEPKEVTFGGEDVVRCDGFNSLLLVLPWQNPHHAHRGRTAPFSRLLRDLGDCLSYHRRRVVSKVVGAGRDDDLSCILRQTVICNAPENMLDTITTNSLVQPLFEVFIPQLWVSMPKVVDVAVANHTASIGDSE